MPLDGGYEYDDVPGLVRELASKISSGLCERLVDEVGNENASCVDDRAIPRLLSCLFPPPKREANQFIAGLKPEFVGR